ncbi:MAG TPA: hypothetical protein VKW09_13885 [bacterium]|nr:hypothetical protein [bacterium]
MRYLGLLGLLLAVAIMLYLAAPRTQQSSHTTYNAATGAAQHAAGAAEQHVRDIMKPPVDGTNP